MNDRKGFGSNFGFLMAAVGSAVGLGNIWGFPNKMGANGGFPFLILYLALALCCGVIIMLGELALGRKTGHGAVGAYQSISKRFKWLGWLGIAAAALIFSFYSALGGYCLRYVVVNFGNLIGAEFGTNGVGGADVFQGLLSQPDVSIAFALAFMLITMLVVMSGVGGGIERVCSVGMPALFFILIICIIRSCTLPGAADGPEVYVRPRLGRGQRHHRRGPRLLEGPHRRRRADVLLPVSGCRCHDYLRLLFG